ncbi:MAG TPA: SDR family oxidoreductase [Rhizomicrobium sp.]|nr:SDR family oxidoreductase [Rhizomicrobium sp.]
MDLHLKGKNAVVLGGSRGIGRAIAELFAAEGANVAICARNADEVYETTQAIMAKGVNATAGNFDISDGAELKTWIEYAGEKNGGIDMLVSNAGAMAQGADPASWEANFKLDVLGAVNAFDAARPFLEAAAEKTGDASFTIIASVSAAESDNASSYGPMKAALIHYAKGLARQHAKRRIRANVVSPGMVYFKGGVWNRVEQGNPDYFKQAVARNPTGRCATPEEIANATVFLASPVSSYTTGVNLLVDGAISRRVNF